MTTKLLAPSTPASASIRSIASSAADLKLTANIDVDAAVAFNLEHAMRHLARAAALCEFDSDQALAGAFYFAARSVAAEIANRNFEWVAECARKYADEFCVGAIPVDGWL